MERHVTRGLGSWGPGCANALTAAPTLVGRLILLCSLGCGLAFAAEPAKKAPETVQSNDNRRTAGQVERGVATIRLRAASGRWRPEGAKGPTLTVEAFGEVDGSLMVPAPLIRVTEGTIIALTITNTLDAPLSVHGLCTRDGRPCPTIDVAPHHTRELRFESGRAGTYHYWGSIIGAPVPFRELAGALVIDPRTGQEAPDRVFVITEWSDLTMQQLLGIFAADDANEAFVAAKPHFTFVVNGLSWPATERLEAKRGENERWRVVNLSSQTHPMHLHGFYFRVKRTGDGVRNQVVDGDMGRSVVTESVPAGGTIDIEWTPEREGNWLFHCHVMSHVAPTRRLPVEPTKKGAHTMSHGHGHDDPSLGMAGMVLGITVLPSGGVKPTSTPMHSPARKIRFAIGANPGKGGAIGVSIRDGAQHDDTPTLVSPGPPVVLQRGESVEVTVENHLTVATSIHWHGLEIESYYDGVHGWSGKGGRTAPMIPPGGSFVVRMTPPRSGTFIYHTHLHDFTQLTSGLYGAFIVTEPGETYDPRSDHVLVIGRNDSSEVAGILERSTSVVVNGSNTPKLVLQAGRKHRLRLVNITPDDLLRISLTRRDKAVTWRPLAKDGATLPAEAASSAPATAVLAVGETLDVEYEATAPMLLWLDIKTLSGKWQAQGRVNVK